MHIFSDIARRLVPVIYPIRTVNSERIPTTVRNSHSSLTLTQIVQSYTAIVTGLDVEIVFTYYALRPYGLSVEKYEDFFFFLPVFCFFL